MPANEDFAQYVVGDEDALSERSFRNTWKRICKKVNLPKGVTPHVLRHTFLTQLQATGRVDIKTLQSIAGHSKITMTMNTYVHKDVGNVEKVSRTSGGLFASTLLHKNASSCKMTAAWFCTIFTPKKFGKC